MRCVSEVNPQAVINSLPEWVLATRDSSENTGTKKMFRNERRTAAKKKKKKSFEHQMIREASVVWDKGFTETCSAANAH